MDFTSNFDKTNLEDGRIVQTIYISGYSFTVCLVKNSFKLASCDTINIIED